MGHLPFEKVGLLWGFQGGPWIWGQEGSKQGLQEVMGNGTFGVRRWLCKVMFEWYLF